MKKTIYRVCVTAMALALWAALGSCTPIAPAGSLFESGGGDDDNMVVVPNRSLYNINETFRRNKDLTILVYSNNGNLTLIPAGDVDIGIVPDLSRPDEVTILPPDADYLFTSKGQYGIEVVYGGGMKGAYSVQVIDPFDLDGGYGGGDGGSGIGVEWAP